MQIAHKPVRYFNMSDSPSLKPSENESSGSLLDKEMAGDRGQSGSGSSPGRSMGVEPWWTRANHWVLHRLARMSVSEERRVLGLTIAVGGLCGLIAVAFHLAIELMESLLIDRAMDAPGRWWIPLTLLSPAFGAFAVALLIRYVFPRSGGSGIPEVKRVFSTGTGRIRFRDGVGKFLGATLQIGCGASLGREGPTVHICSAAATFLGRVFALSPSNQRRLIPVGAAAGIAAAFNAPIAAVTFAIEELVGRLNTTLLSGVVVAAALAAVIERTLLGGHPVFHTPGDYGLDQPLSLLLYALLGVCAALVGTAFVKGLLKTRAYFRSLDRVPQVYRPAIGGLVTGLLAVAGLFFFQSHGVTGGGYAVLGDALHGNVTLRAAMFLCAAKLVATVFSYSSGGTGGIFAPTLFIGGMLGALIGYVDAFLFAQQGEQIGAFALVGMGAVFAAAIRAPMTSVLIIFEMTGNYKLVLPLMIANSVAFVLARKWQAVPIYEALLNQDGIELPQGVKMRPVLATLLVSDAMSTPPLTINAAITMQQAYSLTRGMGHRSFPVVASDDTLVGVLTEARIRRAVAEGHGDDIAHRWARTREYLRANQSLQDALATMQRLGLYQVCVIATDTPTRLVGILTLRDVSQAVLAADKSVSVAPSEPRLDATA